VAPTNVHLPQLVLSHHSGRQIFAGDSQPVVDGYGDESPTVQTALRVVDWSFFCLNGTSGTRRCSGFFPSLRLLSDGVALLPEWPAETLGWWGSAAVKSL
jgi:hypothetical protein